MKEIRYAAGEKKKRGRIQGKNSLFPPEPPRSREERRSRGLGQNREDLGKDSRAKIVISELRGPVGEKWDRIPGNRGPEREFRGIQRPEVEEKRN